MNLFIFDITLTFFNDGLNVRFVKRIQCVSVKDVFVITDSP